MLVAFGSLCFIKFIQIIRFSARARRKLLSWFTVIVTDELNNYDNFTDYLHIELTSEFFT